jgi:hypothetical protein
VIDKHRQAPETRFKPHPSPVGENAYSHLDWEYPAEVGLKKDKKKESSKRLSLPSGCICYHINPKIA